MITYNGHPVVFSLSYVTEPGEGWKGSYLVGSYDTLEELNAALPRAILDCPVYWELKIDFQDKEEE